jgi:TolB-like protein/class 3 adenylate cyclase
MVEDSKHTYTAHQHAAIIFSDIGGYTTLMGSDEEGAIKLLRKNREIHRQEIRKFNGKFIKEIGDGILASFPLASEAVRCAIEIQKKSIEENIPLKIGIHEGDIVTEGDDVLGDAVNIASRLQEATQKGCITISETVYRNVKNKADIQAGFIGEKSLKNVDYPVKTYQVGYIESASDVAQINIFDTTSLKKNSIIVLPFENMSPDPNQEYFSDGLTEEIITDLSYIKDLLVISRSSAKTFKGTRKKIKDIAGEVHVRYVLEGSVRKVGNDLRITAQLIDASTDTHLWAEKYKGTLDDIFDIQEKVSNEIANALKLKLSPAEHQKIAERPIEDIKVYEYYLKALDGITSFSEEGINKALRHLTHAIEIAGDNAQLYGGVAFAYFNLVNIGIKQEDYLLKAEDYANKALVLNPESAIAHVVLGFVDFFRNKFFESLPKFKTALNINPDELMGIAGILSVYHAAGKFKEIIYYTERLMQLDPLSFPANWYNAAQYIFIGEYDQALQPGKRLYELHPENPFSQFLYSLILAYNNKLEEAIPIIHHNAQKNPDTVYAKLGLILKYAFHGDNTQVQKEITNDFEKTVLRDLTYSHHLSGFLALMDNKEEALKWMENAINAGLINYPLIAEKDPFLENIRGEKRFKELLQKVKAQWENFEA